MYVNNINKAVAKMASTYSVRTQSNILKGQVSIPLLKFHQPEIPNADRQTNRSPQHIVKLLEQKSTGRTSTLNLTALRAEAAAQTT
jgi:hypothetical protein